MNSRLVPRACPVCEAIQCTKLFTKGSLHVVRCDVCAMVFANPIDETFITGVFYDQLANPFYLTPDKLESDYSLVRFERELKLFRKFCPRGAVLDVGCSTGAFLFQLRERFGNNYQTIGMDVSGPALDHAERTGTTVMRESFLTADFKGQRFAAVTFWAVLEHLAKPKEFLAQAARILEPEGVCFLLVPNYRSLAVRLLGPNYRYIFPQHVNYFTRSTLRQLVRERSEFQIIHEGATHFNPLVIAKDWRQPRDFVPDEERARLLKRTTAYKQNPAMKPFKAGLNIAERVLGAFRLADNLTMVLRRRCDGTASN